MPVAVVFDIDGVLLDSPHERAWRESLSRLAAGDWHEIAMKTRYTSEHFDTALYQQHIAGKPRLAGARAVLEHFGFPDLAARAVRYATEKQTRLEQLVAAGAWHAYPDGLRLVARLRQCQVRLAAASSSKNANGMMQRIAMQTELAFGQTIAAEATTTMLIDCFDANVCGRNVERGKPAPDLFLLAAAELAVDPRDCVVVEDAPAGVLAAKNGGMQAIGIARHDDQAILGASGADLVVSDLDDVALEPLLSGELATGGRH